MSTEFHRLTISHVENLTRDAVALTFDVPAELAKDYQYFQGQHLTLKADLNGKDIRRSYSICSSVQQQQLQVAVKRIEAGIFSGYANDELKPGMTLEVMPPQGHFYTDLAVENSKNYLFVAVGSGITPILSHIQSILQAEEKSTVTLIYGNKSTAQMMFREKLCFVKNANLERFQWFNLFTMEENDAPLFNGRISGEKVAALSQAKLLDISLIDEVFLCGPEAMIHDVVAYFKT